VNAERAYAGLARELTPPRGTIDLVLADNADYVNGYATPFPTNRIVVYAHPSSDEEALRNYSDWNELVVTHELTHIFHLDRVRGIWRIGQDVFGRNPLLFPNIYQPSWVTEGLAVYYESRLTGVGRLESGEHFMAARAAALKRELPHLDELSRGTSRYPGGEVVYIYGSLMFDYLSRTTTPANVRKFVEESSASLVPFFINHNAKSAFGISFETAWRSWRDSLYTHLPAQLDPPGWKDLSSSGRTAFFPRWVSDSVIYYAGSKGKEVPALYSLDLSGREKNLGRRNGLSPNILMQDGSIVFTQEDLTTAYEERLDLWSQRGGVQTRLTRGARLHSLDVRRDGAVVAVQNTPASTRIVRVSPDGKSIAPISAGSLDEQWSDPRWSPDGARIAAVRLARGRSEIVIFDSAGHPLTAIAGSSSITASPSWSRDGRYVYFSSERSGSSQLYVATVDGQPVEIRRLTSVATGIFQPELSPDGRHLAATLYRIDGYHIGVFPVPDFASLSIADSERVSPRADCAGCIIRSTPARAEDSAALSKLPIGSYSVFPTLLPQYWLPVFQSSNDNGSGFGAETGGSDVIGRHAYDIELLHNTNHGENSAWLYYRYAGLGMPLVGFSASQSYSRASLFNFSSAGAKFVGDLVEKSSLASIQTIFVRPRVRTYADVAIGAEVERKSYLTEPDTLLRHVSPFFQNESTYPAIFLSADWRNARRPALSISQEDGFSLSTTLRQRWSSGASSGTSRSAVAALGAFKSLDLPGFAHHVLALRLAGGIADDRTPTRFSAGGVNGSSVALVSGYDVGGQRRTFGVRGFPAGSEEGIRAAAATLEYRAPISAPSRGFRFLPLFIDKVSALVFSDAGRAYCPASAASGAGACLSSDVGNPWMSSVGAELDVDTGIQLDFQARLRLGVAIPTVNRQQLGAPRSTLYGTFGTSF
jgi:Tol biopolymer transport system component